MTRKNGKNKHPTPIDELIKKEMAQPRISKSAKIAQLKLKTIQINRQPNTAMSGTVSKVILSLGPDHPEKVEISMDAVEPLCRDLRIENKLTDAHGADVKLKKGAHVQVIISRPPGVNRNN